MGNCLGKNEEKPSEAPERKGSVAGSQAGGKPASNRDRAGSLAGSVNRPAAPGSYQPPNPYAADPSLHPSAHPSGAMGNHPQDYPVTEPHSNGTDPEPEWVREEFRAQDRQFYFREFANLPMSLPPGPVVEEYIPTEEDIHRDPDRTPSPMKGNDLLQFLSGDRGWTESGPSMRDAYTQWHEARPDLATSWGEDPEGRALDIPYNKGRGDPGVQVLRSFPDGVKGGPSASVLPHPPTYWKAKLLGDLPQVGSIASRRTNEDDLLRPLLGGEPESGTRLFERASLVRVLPHRGGHSGAELIRLRQRCSLATAMTAGSMTHPRPYGVHGVTRLDQHFADPVELLQPLPGYKQGLTPLPKGQRSDGSRSWMRPGQMLPDLDAQNATQKVPFIVPNVADQIREREAIIARDADGMGEGYEDYYEEGEEEGEEYEYYEEGQEGDYTEGYEQQ
eukprot:Hpha_TRINITY_DN7367_c0_g1::TRINITY_DN7367_c0_g1_i1::g.9910::m.9910